jgi:Fur family peroxide stress response transcriptional regulator
LPDRLFHSTMSKPTPTPADPIASALKAAGLRVTPQRYAVYASLRGRYDHPTAEQLLLDLNQNFPMSSQATIYNSLQTLCDLGLIREVTLQHGVSRYDANVDPHHHFVCRKCGNIQDLPWTAFPALNLNQLSPSLAPESYEITVRGRCDRCCGDNPC